MEMRLEYTSEEVKQMLATAVNKENPKTLGNRQVAKTNVTVREDGSATISLPNGVETNH